MTDAQISCLPADDTRLISLHAARYAQGVCIQCGQAKALTFRLNPAMPSAITHCNECGTVEASAQARDKEREEKRNKRLARELEKAAAYRGFTIVEGGKSE